MGRLKGISELFEADVALWYVGHRSEVRTELGIEKAWRLNQRVIVPKCEGESLSLFEIKCWSDLSPGAFEIPEPSPSVTNDPSRQIEPGLLEIAVIPAVALDRLGHRVGSGKGFYDRLIPSFSPGVVTICPVFDCQVLDGIETQPHDQPVDWIVTESEFIQCSRG